MPLASSSISHALVTNEVSLDLKERQNTWRGKNDCMITNCCPWSHSYTVKSLHSTYIGQVSVTNDPCA